MNIKSIVILLAFILLSSCFVSDRLFSKVRNKFPLAKPLESSNFKTWRNTNLFILRVKLEYSNKVTYYKKGDSVTELTDHPLKDYKFLIKPTWGSSDVVEEVYLYMDDFFDRKIDSSQAVYMSSMPLNPDVSRLMFCNEKFISTYGINHVMHGYWKRTNQKIELKLTDKKNSLSLKGHFRNSDTDPFIEFTEVNHPKPMKKNDNSFIDIRDVFEVNPTKNKDNSETIIGIRFFQNNIDRTLVHPDWEILGKRFDLKKNSKYYRENIENRKITEVMLEGNDRYRVLFKYNDNKNSESHSIIGYRR